MNRLVLVGRRFEPGEDFSWLLAVSVGSGLLAGGSALLGHEQGAHAREGVHPPTMYGCGWR